MTTKFRAGDIVRHKTSDSADCHGAKVVRVVPDVYTRVDMVYVVTTSGRDTYDEEDMWELIYSPVPFQLHWMTK